MEKFDIPLGESEGEALAPITLERNRSKNLGKLATSVEKAERAPDNSSKSLRVQRHHLREISISDKNLVRGAGAVAGAALIGAFTAPAHPVLGAAALAVGGAKLAEKAYEKFEDEYQRAQERERTRHYQSLENYAASFANNSR